MSAQEMIRLEIAGAKIKIPQHVVMQNFLDSLNRGPIELPALRSASAIPAIGEYWPGHGGVNAGLMRGSNGARDYFLIVGVDEKAFVKEIKWGAQGEDEPGAKCEWDGYTNTIALRESKHAHHAAEWTTSIEIDGHRDFFLPSRRQSALAYANVPELFEKCWHWTSTQYSPAYAWVQHFAGGYQLINVQGTEFAARAVRRLVI